MATPQLKTSQIYDEIAALGAGNISDFHFAKIKREIDALRKRDATAAADLMAMLYCFRKEYTKAIEQHKKAIKLSPNFAMLYGNYGITLQQDKKPFEAQGQFLKALSLKPDSLNSPNILANAIAVSLDIFDLETLEFIAENHPEMKEITLPEHLQKRVVEFQTLNSKFGVDDEDLSQASSRIMRFLKQNHLEPVAARALSDPEGGLYISYDLPVSESELHAINESYIDFLMENNANATEISASFRCA